jgi:hypothetical protein
MLIIKPLFPASSRKLKGRLTNHFRFAKDEGTDPRLDVPAQLQSCIVLTKEKKKKNRLAEVNNKRQGDTKNYG